MATIIPYRLCTLLQILEVCVSIVYILNELMLGSNLTSALLRQPIFPVMQQNFPHQTTASLNPLYFATEKI